MCGTMLSDVLTTVDRMCSGRRSCRVRALDEEFDGVHPCHEDLKNYLQVTYTCVPGQNEILLDVHFILSDGRVHIIYIYFWDKCRGRNDSCYDMGASSGMNACGIIYKMGRMSGAGVIEA